MFGSSTSARLCSAHHISQHLSSGHRAVKAGEILMYMAWSKPQGNQFSLELSCMLLYLLFMPCFLFFFKSKHGDILICWKAQRCCQCFPFTPALWHIFIGSKTEISLSSPGSRANPYEPLASLQLTIEVWNINIFVYIQYLCIIYV